MLKSYYNFFRSEKDVSRFILNSIFTAILFVWLALPSHAQRSPLRPLHVNENGNRYWVGDRITLQVASSPDRLATIQPGLLSVLPEDANVDLRELGWFIDPRVELISSQASLVVTPIKQGKLELPALNILDSNGNVLTTTEPWSIESLAEGLTPPKEEFALLPAEQVGVSTAIWALLFFLILLLSALIFFGYRKWKKRPKPIVLQPPPQEPKIPNHTAALQKLNFLYAENAYHPEKLKPVAFGISEILKDYLSLQLNVDARESTTHEMIALLKDGGVGFTDLQTIRSLFEKLDFIKFTNYYKPPFSENIISEREYLEFKQQAILIIERWAGGGSNHEI